MDNLIKLLEQVSYLKTYLDMEGVYFLEIATGDRFYHVFGPSLEGCVLEALNRLKLKK